MKEKSAQIQFHHIKSHQGTATPYQRGNSRADEIAKDFLRIGEKKQPFPYFMLGEEEYVIFQNHKLIEGDIRSFLKSQENEHLLAIWKRKKTNGRLIRRFPRQIDQLRRDIWKWTIQKMDGRAWIFFIFAVCDWLPTNYRLHKRDQENINCDLCQMGNTFSAAQQRPKQHLLRVQVEKVLAKWNLPYYALGSRPETSVTETWCRQIDGKLQKQCIRITEEKLRQLVQNYLTANRKNRHINTDDNLQKHTPP